jgi:hypothetical protein
MLLERNNNLFTKSKLLQVYLDLKRRKVLDREKGLPIGIDGVGSNVFEKNLEHSIQEIHRKLQSVNGLIPYTFAPLVRLSRSKAAGDVRFIHIARIRDQIVLRLIHDEIRAHYKEIGKEIRFQSPYSIIKRFDLYVQETNYNFIVRADISKFYDNIPRQEVIAMCRVNNVHSDVLQLLQKWSDTLTIRNTYLNCEIQPNIYDGLPQGLSISSLLAEIYAFQIDDHFRECPGYFRFIDDILFVCSDLKDAKEKYNVLNSFINGIGLKLSTTKTGFHDLRNGVKWLGLFHYPNRKLIPLEKLNQSIKPILTIKKKNLLEIDSCTSKEQANKVICKLIREINRYIDGRNKVRIRWYSLCEDQGQWKQMDKFIHQVIRDCIRKAGLKESDFPYLPSVHSKLCSYKSIRSHKKC